MANEDAARPCTVHVDVQTMDRYCDWLERRERTVCYKSDAYAEHDGTLGSQRALSSLRSMDSLDISQPKAQTVAAEGYQKDVQHKSFACAECLAAILDACRANQDDSKACGSALLWRLDCTCVHFMV